MGHYSYSFIDTRDIDLVNKHIQEALVEVCPLGSRVERVGCPLGLIEKWCVYLPGWTLDATFSVGLCKDKRLEFKLPVSSEGIFYQEKVRHRIVLRIKKDVARSRLTLVK